MKKLAAILALCVMAFAGCKDSEWAQVKSLGKKHRITLYGCDGKAIHSWTSTGNVSNEAQSDGWYFEDEQTGKLVEVTGTLVIEQE